MKKRYQFSNFTVSLKDCNVYYITNFYLVKPFALGIHLLQVCILEGRKQEKQPITWGESIHCRTTTWLPFTSTWDKMKNCEGFSKCAWFLHVI